MGAEEKYTIVAVRGSVRPGNYTNKALALVIDELEKEEHVGVRVVDPATLDLPLPGQGDSTSADELQMLVEEAGGEDASSPSFALVNEYSTAEGDIYHADCYRLRSPAEAIDLDLWQLAKKARMMLVEWPLKGGDNVPTPTVVVKFWHTDAPHLRLVSVKQC